MLSVKIIVDIFVFVDLIDLKSFIGNLFIFQLIYIVVCVFLMEFGVNVLYFFL